MSEPYLYDFMNIDRSYQSAVQNYRPEIPADFNFAYDVIDRQGQDHDKTAVIAVSGDGETVQEISYSEMAERSNRFANGLSGLGMQQGDFVALIGNRIPEWYDALFGCMKTGAVSMPGTTLLTSKDIAYRINHSKASGVIVTPEHCEKVDAVRAECPTLKHFIVIGDPRPGWTSSHNMCDAASPVIERRVPVRATDMMMAYFTSGTTALPKMVPRDFAYGLAHASTGLFWMDLRRDDVHWTLTDTGWAKAAWGMLFPQFLVGSSVVLHDGAGFDPVLHLELIKKLGVTTFCAPPTAYRMFAQLDLRQFDLSSIRRSMGAGEPLNPEVIRYWKEQTGTTIADGYGQTETINIIANFPDQPVKPGSMGQPVPGIDMRVVDDEGKEMPPGEIGHIACRITDPHPPGLFEGYYTGGEPDRKAFRNGYYYTGDTAKRDEDGYFWFVGRADDLISSAGYRISPFEVESALLEHPAVAESAVIGEPDELRNQIVSAYIILAKGYVDTPDLAQEIQEFCKQNTAPYKYPRRIYFVDELPKTISGKIRRVELRGEG
ncbi:MAG TPA: acyl--CoA ligase [Alphaproteobacteria bacterium]|nr:acyl--CoA ligase [Alphaproteobacteria bacterium]